MTTGGEGFPHDVMNVIRQLCQQNTLWRLTKAFKGIEITQEVQIIAVDQDSVVIKTNSCEFCGGSMGQVYLQNPEFLCPATAQLKALNPARGLFLLTMVIFKDTPWFSRQNDRVQPAHPTYATLFQAGNFMRLPLENISIHGAKLLVYRPAQKGLHMELGTPISLQLPVLSNEQQEHWGGDYSFDRIEATQSTKPDFKVKGRVIYQVTVDDELQQLGIRFTSQSLQTTRLQEYISARKEEILLELYQNYLHIFGPQAVHSFFF
jgi:hypothetical protein